MEHQKKPWEWNKDLLENRLVILGEIIFNSYNSTAKIVKEHLRDLSYVRGTACFAIAHDDLVKLHENKTHEWFRLVNTTYATVMEIGNTRCRFFTADNVENPKSKTFNLAQGENLFPREDFPEMYNGVPILWRWIIQKPIDSEFGSFDVYFVGFDAEQNIISQWHFGNEKVLDNLDNIVTMAEIEQDIDMKISRKSDDEKQSNA